MSDEQGYPTYPRDIWEYLKGDFHKDLSYMPSREDRDKLLSADDQRRVHIWDYFFRIRPEDVGKPHRREIDELRKKLSRNINHQQEMTRKAKTEIEQFYQNRKKTVENHDQELQRVEARLQDLRDEADMISARYDSEIQPFEAKIEQHRSKLKEAPAQKRRNGQLSIFLGGGGFLACAALSIIFDFARGDTNGSFFIPVVVASLICYGPLLAFGLFVIGTAKNAGGKHRFEMERLTQTIENLRGKCEIELKQAREVIAAVETELATIQSDQQSELAEMDQSIASIRSNLESLRQEIELNEEEINQRIAFLEAEIEHLVSQIPPSPTDDTIYEWLKEDLKSLEEKSKVVTGLHRPGQLAPIRFENSEQPAPNPLPIMGPGELQDPKDIPPPFRVDHPDRDPDRVKHLNAARAAHILDNNPEVFYGVYKIEHILVAKDMLATRGFFFDFITGKTTAEQITEQYYKDVVAIAQVHEFRKIELMGDDPVKIEDAPTFTMSLASGERRTVTFVNTDYFNGIHTRLGLPKDEIQRIKSLSDAKEIADNSITTLRRYLRIHKGTDNR